MATTYYNATSSTWTGWITSGTTTTTMSTTAWMNWNSTTTTSTGTGYYANDVWTGWNQPRVEYVVNTNRPVETEEEREARELREAELREQRRIEREEREAAQAAAKDRAKATFLELLTEKQRVEFESTGKVSVVGSDGHTYHVDTTRGISGNVVQVRDGQPVLRLCAHAGYHSGCPDYDQFLQQIIHLQLDAEGFLRVANRHTLRREVEFANAA